MRTHPPGRTFEFSFLSSHGPAGALSFLLFLLIAVRASRGDLGDDALHSPHEANARRSLEGVHAMRIVRQWKVSTSLSFRLFFWRETS